MGEITVKVRIPKELENSKEEIEEILEKNAKNLIRKLEILKRTEGIFKTEKSWQELEAEMYEDLSG